VVGVRTSSELLAHHFFALYPQRLGAFGVDRVGAHAFAGGGVLVQFGDVAILAVAAADCVMTNNVLVQDLRIW
jgi:hypothetical protein